MHMKAAVFSKGEHVSDIILLNVHIYCLSYGSVQSELNYLMPFRDKAYLRLPFLVLPQLDWAQRSQIIIYVLSLYTKSELGNLWSMWSWRDS